MSRSSQLTMAGRLAALLSGTYVAVKASADPDLWGHLRYGLDVIDTWRLTSVDPYSFTQDKAWVNHEWLSEVVFGLAYRLAGTAGLTALKCGLLGAAFLLLARLARQTRADVRWWLLALTFINLGPLGLTFRPQLWTIVGLTLVCSMLMGHVRLVWMPLLFAVWANMHGGWIVGGGVVGLWLAGRLLDTRSISAVVPGALALVSAVAATLVNPYGWRLWSFLAETVRVSRPDITEWRPYWERFEAAHVILLPLAIAAFLATVLIRRRTISASWVLPSVWLGINGIFVSRLAPLFALVACAAMLAAWVEASPEEPAGTTARDTQRRLVDAVAVGVMGVALAGVQMNCLPVDDDWGPDVQAASALDAPGAQGRLVVPFDWGEWALWRWGPRLRVSIDGRRETIYSEDTIKVQQALGKGQVEGIGFLNRVRPEYAWLHATPSAPAALWLVQNGYRIDVQTPKSLIATRSDLPPLRPSAPIRACAF